jgi:hypothetical protein
MLQAAGVWNSTNFATLPYEATEYIITVMVANGIANINYNVSIINNYASELTALAMKSTPTTRLHNIGAGIATVTSYSERTRVEIRDGALQIAFVDTEEGVKVKENRAYG